MIDLEEVNWLVVLLWLVVAGLWYYGSWSLAYELGLDFWEMRMFRMIVLIAGLLVGIVWMLYSGSDKA
jgi:hypothetical protein